MHTFVRLLSIGLLLSLAGCFAFSDVKRPELVEDTGVTEEAGTDADTGPSCTRDPMKGELPCPPVAAIPGDEHEITFAIETVRLSQEGLEVPDGLDLDGIDSTAEAGNSGLGECTAGAATEIGFGGVDGVHGIDNTLGLELWSFIGQNFSLECEAEKVHRKGQGTVLIHVSQWNGTADDAQVKVMVVPAVLGTHQPDWATLEDAQAAATTWTWGLEQVETVTATGDGTTTELLDLPFALDGEGIRPPEPCWIDGAGELDWYFANPLYFNELKVPRVAVTTAYISDRWLVVPLPNNSSFDLYTDRRGVQVKLRFGHLVAQIDEAYSSFERAFAAGRFSVPDLVAVGAEIGICTDNTETYKTAADLFADPNGDLAPETLCSDVDENGVPIGALSVGVGFEGKRVSYAGMAGGPAGWTVPNACSSPWGNGRTAPSDCGSSTVPRTWYFSPGPHCPPL